MRGYIRAGPGLASRLDTDTMVLSLATAALLLCSLGPALGCTDECK